MLSWISRLFRRRAGSTRDTAESASSPALALPDNGTQADEHQTPDWAAALAEPPLWAQEQGETLKKLARAQGKLGLRLDELERKLEGGLEDLRGTLSRRTAHPSAAGEGQPGEGGFGDVLDAIDLLCEVKRQSALPPGCAEGLEGVVARLDRALAQAGLSRHGAVGQPADGRRFRVVGTEDIPDLQQGVVTRLVRHAAMRGTQLVREGEVLINRREP
jgi:hypothetical protein